MHRAARRISAFAAIFAGSLAHAAATADVYGSRPDVESPVVSPDGAFIAMVRPFGDLGGVRIVRIGATECNFEAADAKVHSIFWGSADRLVLRVSFTRNFGRSRRRPEDLEEIFAYVSVDTNCENAQELMVDLKDYQSLVDFRFIGRTRDQKRLLFAALDVDFMVVTPVFAPRLRDTSRLDVYAVDPATGKSERYEAGNRKTIGWIADTDGRLRLRIDVDERTGERTTFARVGALDTWELVDDTTASDGANSLNFQGISGNSDIAYVATRNGADTTGIFEFDLGTRKIGRRVYQNPRVDANELLTDDYSGRPVGVSYIEDFPTVEYFDSSYARMLADATATFPGEHVEIVSASSDAKKFIVRVEGRAHQSGAYQFVDLTVPAIDEIGPRYSRIPAQDFGAVRSFTYRSRDGLTIPAYLTLPPRSTGKGMPLVVMPHGGPASRDDASFDPWAQFLASRGYAVLQPQFRGSSGFGASFEEAGRFKWGLEMQNDISDGVKALIADGTVDAARICIFGWSYGGYAAMAGLAFTPTYYKCGVAGGGISDLLMLVGDLKRESPSVHLGGKYWLDIVGDPLVDKDRLIATSPVKRVADIQAPLLLIHGKDDTVVPIRQSATMANAMRRAGKVVEFVQLEGGDHWLTKASTSKQVLSELETFLAKHLK